MNILLVSTTGIGDTLFGTPAIRALRKSFPDAAIDIVLHRRRASILRLNPHINGIYRFGNNALVKFLSAHGLRKKFYDHILVFHANNAVLSLLRKLRYGQILTYQDINDPACRIKRVVLPPDLHSILRRIKLAEEIGARADGTYMELHVSDRHKKEADNLLRANLGPKSDSPLIGLNIGAAEKGKIWPARNFAALIDAVREHRQVRMFINGSPGERALYRHLGRYTDLSEILFFCGTDLLETAALISRCDLFITNDTGPLHMALAVGTPTVSFFCPTDPRTVGPMEQDPRNVVINKEIPCEVCTGRDCKEPFCMEEITVEEALQGVDKILNRGEPWFNLPHRS